MVEEDHDALHGMLLPEDNLYQLYLAILTYRLILPEIEALCNRLKLGKDDADLLHSVAQLREDVGRLQVGTVLPSEVSHLLAPYSGPTVLVTWVATGSEGVRTHLSRYWEIYRHIKPALTGDDLKQMGFRPGPIFGQVLDALRDARLDGKVSSKGGERAIAREILEEQAIG
jgi:tRNA nucleotidyltransferase (CCA-adding enzyme)